VRWLDRLLVLLTTVVVVVSVLPLGARWWWVLDLTTHFRLQYLLSTVLLLVLTLPRRLWRASAALVAAGAISLMPVLPYWPSQNTDANAAAPGGTPLTLASVNVSYRQFSARRLLDSLAATAPDVVLIVEFTPHAAEVLAALDERYTHSYKLPAEGPYGIAVWSRYELEAPTTFLLGRVPAIEARVHTPGGAFTFLGVHLSAPTTPRRAAQRNEELALLAARRSGIAGPVVVAGDFNVTPYSPFYGDWLTASGLTDTRRGRTLSVSWPTMLPFAGIPIDHVAVNRDFDIVRHRRLPNFDSDHYGVLADLALHADASPQ
jgi:endonuclease/exonuclease/phosphatase (EEP) superfamily protein YafD